MFKNLCFLVQTCSKLYKFVQKFFFILFPGHLDFMKKSKIISAKVCLMYPVFQKREVEQYSLTMYGTFPKVRAFCVNNIWDRRSQKKLFEIKCGKVVHGNPKNLHHLALLCTSLHQFAPKIFFLSFPLQISSYENHLHFKAERSTGWRMGN